METRVFIQMCTRLGELRNQYYVEPILKLACVRGLSSFSQKTIIYSLEVALSFLVFLFLYALGLAISWSFLSYRIPSGNDILLILLIYLLLPLVSMCIIAGVLMFIAILCIWIFIVYRDGFHREAAANSDGEDDSSEDESLQEILPQ